MRRALEAVLAVLIAALALPAATVGQSVAPSGPTPVEVAQFNQAIADATWEALPLRVRGDRPDVELRVPIAEDEWPTVFGQCLADAGYAGGISSNGDGAFVPEVIQPDQQFDDDMLLAFYRCVVVHPRAFTSRLLFFCPDRLSVPSLRPLACAKPDHARLWGERGAKLRDICQTARGMVAILGDD